MLQFRILKTIYTRREYRNFFPIYNEKHIHVGYFFGNNL